MLGILTVILSFLFFGRATSTYDVIISLGLLFSITAYLIILFKDTKRSKILWTLIVFASIGIQQFTESLMIRLSYLYFINQNEQDLSKANQILIPKASDIIWGSDSSLWERNNLSMLEGTNIKNYVANKNISFVIKDSTKIYYRTFGMLDVSHGVFYFYTTTKPDNRYKHLTGNWYY